MKKIGNKDYLEKVTLTSPTNETIVLLPGSLVKKHGLMQDCQVYGIYIAVTGSRLMLYLKNLNKSKESQTVFAVPMSDITEIHPMEENFDKTKITEWFKSMGIIEEEKKEEEEPSFIPLKKKHIKLESGHEITSKRIELKEKNEMNELLRSLKEVVVEQRKSIEVQHESLLEQGKQIDKLINQVNTLMSSFEKNWYKQYSELLLEVLRHKG